MKTKYQKDKLIITISVLITVQILFSSSIMAQDLTVDYWLQKGDEFYYNDSYDLALRCYDKAIEIDPMESNAWKSKGNVLNELGQTVEANVAFAKANDLGYEDTTRIDVVPNEMSEEISGINESIQPNIMLDGAKSETSIIFNSIILLFDASHSMSGDKMSNAKIAIKEFISGLDFESTEVSLIVFYDCDNIKVEQPFTTDKSLISSKIDTIQPSGSTPLNKAINFAKRYIDENANGMKRNIIMFTDGIETCTSQGTYSERKSIKISVIGYNIRKDSDLDKSLRNFAEMVHGNYLNSGDGFNSEGLARSLEQAYAGMGTGDVQVTLTWNANADIDLYVEDPSGDEIYYRNPTVSSGGELDIDNRCSNFIMGMPENIYWPLGKAPVGRYKVRVNYYDDCGRFGVRTGPVDWTIKTKVNGRMYTFSGTLYDIGDTQDVTTFQF